MFYAEACMAKILQNRRRVFIVLLVTAATLFRHVSPAAHGQARRNDSIMLAARHLSAADNRLLQLRPTIFDAVSRIQLDVLEALRQSDSWAKITGVLQGEVHHEAIGDSFRDEFSSHAKNLTQILELLVDLGHLGQTLEATLKQTAVLQSEIEHLSKKPVATLVADIQIRLRLLLSDFKTAGQRLAASKEHLDNLTTTMKKYDKQSRQLHHFMGPPKTEDKKWEKEVADTAVKNSARELEQLQVVRLILASMAQLIVDLGETLIAQQKAVNSS
jgi:hypothetical protein